MRYHGHRVSLLVAGVLVTLLAGCNQGGSASAPPSESPSPTDSASATPDPGTSTDSSGTGATTTVTEAPAAAPQAPVTTTVTQAPDRNDRHQHNGLRPMNPNERQQFQHCQRDPRQSGCGEYTGDALRRRGIDPNG